MPVVKARFFPGAQPPSAANYPALLQAIGPLLPVQVEVPAALAEQITRAGGQIPHPVTGKALVDTGASVSGVHQPVLSGLGVKPVGTTSMDTAGGPQQTSLYPIKIVMIMAPLALAVEYSSVVGVDLTGMGIIALLGRDFLKRTLLIYDGPTGEVTLAY